MVSSLPLPSLIVCELTLYVCIVSLDSYTVLVGGAEFYKQVCRASEVKIYAVQQVSLTFNVRFAQEKHI